MTKVKTKKNNAFIHWNRLASARKWLKENGINGIIVESNDLGFSYMLNNHKIYASWKTIGV